MAGEDDMAFFESEDERWMMGDFDIDLDVDLGRPIDFEGDGSVANPDDSGFQDANSSGNVPSVQGSTTSVQRNGAVSGHNNNAGNAGLNSSTNGNGNSGQRLGGSNLANPTSTGATNPSRPPNGFNSNGNGNHGNGNKGSNLQSLPNMCSGGNGTSIGNGNNRSQPLNGSNGSTGTGNNENGGRMNLSDSTSSVQPSGSGNRPSAGGFTFPPGVVSLVSPSLMVSRARC